MTRGVDRRLLCELFKDHYCLTNGLERRIMRAFVQCVDIADYAKRGSKSRSIRHRIPTHRISQLTTHNDARKLDACRKRSKNMVLQRKAATHPTKHLIA